MSASSHSHHAEQGPDVEPVRYDELAVQEIWWRDKQGFLEEHGYMLRQRFRPGWIPSWLSSNRPPGLHEDSWPLTLRSNLIDAAQISDGRLVFIKIVDTDSKELEIAGYFSQPPHREDPRNHCVPILDTFQDNEDPSMSYIVMPFLRLSDDPPCLLVDDIADFVDQMLEGLVFMHEHHVAHRDCAPMNIMMDANGLFPRGYHPQHLDFMPDMRGKAPHVPRIVARPAVTYYYVDFGMSSQFTPDSGSRLVTGMEGLDREVPELSNKTPYDPFKVDVFILGNVLRKHFLTKYSNVDFLSPLVELMTQRSPDSRPSAAEALKKWRSIRRRLWPTQLASRLRPPNAKAADYCFKGVRGFFTLGLAISRRFLRRASR